MFDINYDSKEVDKALSNVKKAIDNTSAILIDRINEVMLKDVQDHFMKGQEGSNEIADNVYNGSKRWAVKENGEQSYLMKSGNLLSSIKKNTLSKKIGLITDSKYARIHQFGGLAGRDLKSFIPKRSFLWLDSKAFKKIQALYYEYIQRIWRS